VGEIILSDEKLREIAVSEENKRILREVQNEIL
jgi:hypothetical protein